jgi:hypothetical protein
MINNTLLQRVHQDINTAFQNIRLEHSQAQISYSNLEGNLSKNAGELRMVGATNTDLLEDTIRLEMTSLQQGDRQLVKTLGRKLAGILGSCMFLYFCGAILGWC